LDEVGRGTSTFDGVSIAWAICEWLIQGKAKPRTLFATHYHELIQLEEHFPRVKNYNIKVRETKDGIVFLRKVVTGGSDRSYGIHVARLAGIPEAVTARAEKILEVLESESAEASDIIEGRIPKPASKARKKQTEDSRQSTFFDFGSTEADQHAELFEEIKKISPDDLTPIQALQKLTEWQNQLKAKEKP